MLGRPVDTRALRAPRLSLALDDPDPGERVLGTIATVEIEAPHALVGRLPLDARMALDLVRESRSALGVATVSLPDSRRGVCWAELGAAEGAGTGAPLVTHWEPPVGGRAREGRAVARVRSLLARLGAWPLPAALLPGSPPEDGGGTLPMAGDDRPFTTTPDGWSRDLEGLLVADGAALPFLPAHEPAFTLMANAARIGARLGAGGRA
jgi:hypothetical protein